MEAESHRGLAGWCDCPAMLPAARPTGSPQQRVQGTPVLWPMPPPGGAREQRGLQEGPDWPGAAATARGLRHGCLSLSWRPLGIAWPRLALHIQAGGLDPHHAVATVQAWALPHAPLPPTHTAALSGLATRLRTRQQAAGPGPVPFWDQVLDTSESRSEDLGPRNPALRAHLWTV